MNPEPRQIPEKRTCAAQSRTQFRDRAIYEMQEAFRDMQKATLMKEEAAEARLHLWLDRFTQLQGHIDRDTALEQCLDAALSVTSADYANIQLVHPGGRGLVLKAQRGFREPFLDFFAFVQDRRTACGLAMEERRPVVVQDVIRSPIFAQTRGLDVMLDAGVRAVRSAPLVGRSGEVLGMLSVHHRQPRDHIDSELVRFQALAVAVAALIDGGQAGRAGEPASAPRSQ
jgi:GAF domain-containing protein